MLNEFLMYFIVFSFKQTYFNFESSIQECFKTALRMLQNTLMCLNGVYSMLPVDIDSIQIWERIAREKVL